MSQSKLIITSLIHNEPYARKVLPFIKPEYFQQTSEKTVFGLIRDFVDKYNSIPTVEALLISLEEKKMDEKLMEAAKGVVSEVRTNNVANNNETWLIDKTESFCRDQAIYNALMSSILIADGKDSQKSTDSIPSILQEALGVSFNAKVGHDYFENYESRFEYYNRKEFKLPFKLDILNNITKGGISRKTLTILVAGPNVGKSATMCSMAADYLLDGVNVLYVTGEMSEEEIGRRIDANLLDIESDKLEFLELKSFSDLVKSVRTKTTGKLIIKEYATSSATSNDIKRLVNELNLKKSFVPDVIFIDYMNIFLSARHKTAASDGGKSYAIVKSISEEFRGLAVENNLAVITATQFGRSSHNDTDPDETGVADSFGPIMTADLVLALVRNQEIAKQEKMMMKQLKSRYGDKHRVNKFFVGCNMNKTRLYNLKNPLEGISQETIEDDSIFNKTKVGMQLLRERANTAGESNV